MLKNHFTTARLTRASVIAALYVAVSFVSAPIASGAIQVRLSEALTVLALVFPDAVPALFIGCLLSNFITGCAIYDVVFGSLITLISATCTYFSGKLIKNVISKILVGGFFPVALNAVFLPLIWQWCYGYTEYVYILQVVFLLAGQGISVYALGAPLYLSVKKLNDKGIKFFN